MNQDAKLARMANQIAGFFRSYPEAEAAAGIHDHIVAFWTPKMRDKLNQQVAAEVEGLDALVVTAMRSHSTAHSPAEKEAAGPGELGEIGASDAG